MENISSSESTLRTTGGRKKLLGIAPEAYRHPQDQQAAAALRAVPGFELAASKLSRYSLEHILYVEYCASGVKVTPRQCSNIYKLLQEACAVLDVPEPALFLSQTPIANAFALGRERPVIVLHTGLVELMNDDELLGVIAHELGHIHCGHSVYRLMLVVLELLTKAGAGALGLDDVLTFPIRMALLDWSRKAEFSADRAAVLATQNPETVFSALFKLTGGSPKIFEQMDREEYLKQADEYDQPDAGKLDKFYKSAIEGGRTHPIPVLRSREVLRYGDSDDYKTILSGRYARYEKGGKVLASAYPSEPVPCPQCRQEADPQFSFCVHCGADITEAKLRALAEKAKGTSEGGTVGE